MIGYHGVLEWLARNQTECTVPWLAQTLPLNVCDAPEAQFGPSAWLTPNLSLQDIADATLRGLRHPAGSLAQRKSAEQSQNVYENKGRGQKVTGWRRRCP
jgi:hypothetical protein